MRAFLAILALLLLLRLALAEPPSPAECEADQDARHLVSVRWQGPEGIVLGAITVAVAYPRETLVIPGKGTDIPADTRAEGPRDALIALSDADGEVRLVVAKGGEGLADALLARVRFRRCQGAAPSEGAALRCRVLDASDPATNALGDLICTATLD